MVYQKENWTMILYKSHSVYPLIKYPISHNTKQMWLFHGLCSARASWRQKKKTFFVQIKFPGARKTKWGSWNRGKGWLVARQYGLHSSLDLISISLNSEDRGHFEDWMTSALDLPERKRPKENKKGERDTRKEREKRRESKKEKKKFLDFYFKTGQVGWWFILECVRGPVMGQITQLLC